ncbi:MAG TPA: aminotransferase class I/II-fold pyridoxal phosphate-dependent enzyme [bacterium]|nr:aminotransferase class I/II-fold pyridoxal phosphate-dependent enzyme [bacterium]
MARIAQAVTAQVAYPFATLAAKKRAMEVRGHTVIDLSIGDASLPAPDAAVTALRERSLLAAHHHYSSYNGILPLRRAIADWIDRRFGVAIDPEREVTALMGSKEGLFRFPQAVLDPGDAALHPDPGYPVYPLAIRDAGGRPVAMDLSEKNGFLPDLGAIPEKTRRDVRMIIVNFPSNPTGATAGPAFYGELYRMAVRYDWIVVSDNAYCEIYDGAPPRAALEFDPKHERTVEFFSFSKTYSMTGWRLGWACGNADLVQALVKVKGLQDSAPFEPVQFAGIAALSLSDADLAPTRRFYADNRALMKKALDAAGIPYFDAQAGFYLWARVPAGLSAAGLTDRLLEERRVLVTPGTAFGPNGEGWFRIAATRHPDEMTEAARRISQGLPA